MIESVLQLGIPGGPEVLLLLALAVLLFGANKIPKLARSSGQAIGEFQKGREQVEQELQDMKGGEGQSPSETQSAGEVERTTETETETETETSTSSESSKSSSSSDSE